MVNAFKIQKQLRAFYRFLKVLRHFMNERYSTIFLIVTPSHITKLIVVNKLQKFSHSTQLYVIQFVLDNGKQINKSPGMYFDVLVRVSK